MKITVIKNKVTGEEEREEEVLFEVEDNQEIVDMDVEDEDGAFIQIHLADGTMLIINVEE